MTTQTLHNTCPLPASTGPETLVRQPSKLVQRARRKASKAEARLSIQSLSSGNTPPAQSGRPPQKDT